MAFDSAEMILCVPHREVEKAGIGEPYQSDPEDNVLAKLIGLSTFQMRGRVEDDPAWRQLIPYVISWYDGKILLLERLATQGESRLHNLMSIGVGGHINPVDSTNGSRNVLLNGLWRELKEELNFEGQPEITLKGLINFLDEDVAKVHLGFVYIAKFAEEPSIRETDKMTGRFIEPAELSSHYDRMEGWSKILIDNLEL